MAYGRPLKGRSRRVPITVHASVETLDIIDDYVEAQNQQRESQYSRSDSGTSGHHNMKQLGIARRTRKKKAFKAYEKRRTKVTRGLEAIYNKNEANEPKQAKITSSKLSNEIKATNPVIMWFVAFL